MLRWGGGHAGKKLGHWGVPLKEILKPAHSLLWAALKLPKVLYLPHASATACLTTSPEQWGKATTNSNLWTHEFKSAFPSSSWLLWGIVSQWWQGGSHSTYLHLTSLRFHIFLLPTLSSNHQHKHKWFLKVFDLNNKEIIKPNNNNKLCFTRTKMSINRTKMSTISINKLCYSYTVTSS